MSGRVETSGTAVPHPRLRPHRLRDRFIAYGSVGSIALFFIAVFVLFSVSTEDFATLGNILNVVRQSAPLLMVAATMTLVITTGGIDLSVGSVLALVSALCAILIRDGIPWPVVVLLMLGCGALIGAIQGFFVAYEGIPSFIVTLAGLSIVRGLALLMTGGYSIPIPASLAFVDLGRGWLAGMPVPALVAAAVMLVAIVIFNQTPFGRYVTGVGANAEAVRRAGVNTRLVTLCVYVLSGTMAALAGLVLAARLGSGSSNSGQGFELDVIAAVVLGGTSLFGGRGTMIGTVLGALTVAVIGNGLILAHLSPFLTPIVTGSIILIAIWMNFRIFRGAVRKR